MDILKQRIDAEGYVLPEVLETRDNLLGEDVILKIEVPRDLQGIVEVGGDWGKCLTIRHFYKMDMKIYSLNNEHMFTHKFDRFEIIPAMDSDQRQQGHYSVQVINEYGRRITFPQKKEVTTLQTQLA